MKGSQCDFFKRVAFVLLVLFILVQIARGRITVQGIKNGAANLKLMF